MFKVIFIFIAILIKSLIVPSIEETAQVMELVSHKSQALLGHYHTRVHVDAHFLLPDVIEKLSSS